jgi:hypothetical protein
MEEKRMKEKQLKVDGYARLVVHPNGEDGLILDCKTNDIHLDEYLGKFVEEDVDSLLDLNQILQINPEAKGCLVLATFAYRTVSYVVGDTTEYEDETTVRDVIILQDNYKEQWRKNLTVEYGFATLEELKKNDCYEDIEQWEEFYNEPFEFYKEKIQSTEIFFPFDNE